MNTKIGTNNFPQRSLNVREQGGGKNTTDPIAMKKAFGDKDLSQILNEVADPNYKANKRKVKGVGNDELGKDAFFKLMLTQLKQQDPTNPLKSHEMAAQLAQFSSVEQLSNMNKTLTSMSQKDSTDGRFEVLNMIGKVVSGDSSQIDRLKGDKAHNIEFNLGAPADNVTVKIKDAKGMVVKKYDLKALKKGTNKISWNGLHEDGKDARVGQYRAEITAQAQGRPIKVNTQFTGPVDAVQFSDKGPLLVVGGKTLNLKDVKKIGMNAVSKDNNVNQVLQPKEKVSKGAFEEKKALSNLHTVQMDKNLRDKIEESTKKAKKEKLVK